MPKVGDTITHGQLSAYMAKQIEALNERFRLRPSTLDERQFRRLMAPQRRRA